MGYFVAHKQGKKIYQIDDHIGMTISGGVADAQYVVEVLQSQRKTIQTKQRQTHANKIRSSS